MALNDGAAYLSTAGEGSVPTWPGVYAGTVVNNHDPLGVGRLQLNVPQVLGNAVSAWAVPAGSYFTIPTNGTPVSVTFLGGDPAQPLWSGPLDLNPLVQSAAGPNVTYSSTAPQNPKVGDIWYQIVNGIQGPPQVWTFHPLTSTYSWVQQAAVGVYGSAGAFLVYSGTPALGNLIGSTSGTVGTDTLGNQYLNGICNYFPTGGSNITTIQMIDGGLTLYHGTFTNAAATQIGFMGDANTGGIEIISGLGFTPLVISAPLQLGSYSSVPALTLGASQLYGNNQGNGSMINGGGWSGSLVTSTAIQGGNTNNTTSMNAMFTPVGIPANDTIAGTANTYRVTCGGHGTQATTTATTLNFQLHAFGMNWGASTDSGGIAAGTNFHWRFVGELIVAAAGSASFFGEMVMSQSTASAQGHPTAMDTQVASGVPTGAATNITLQAGWTSVANSPTLVCTGALVERLGT